MAALKICAADQINRPQPRRDCPAEIDPEKIYTIVTIDYLLRLGGGAYAILQEAKSTKPLDITLRDAILAYIKSETAAGRPIRGTVDNRFVQVGPGPKTTEIPR